MRFSLIISTFFLFLVLGPHVYGLKYRTSSDEDHMLSADNPFNNLVKSSVSEFELTSSLLSLIENGGKCDTYPVFKVNQARNDVLMLLKAVDLTLSAALMEVADPSEKEVLTVVNLQVAHLSAQVIKELDTVTYDLCFSCSSFMNTVNEYVQSIINTLEKSYPQIKDRLWFETVVTFINGILSIGSSICGDVTDEFPLLTIQDFSPKSFDNKLDMVKLLEIGAKECLTKEQKDDIEEVLQLAANLLNTFSQWIRESEVKAQSKEFKFILEKLAGFLDEERDFLEKRGEVTIEKGCEQCAQLVEFVSEVVNLGETVLKTVVPFWKIVPYLETTLHDINSVLAKARQICPYQFFASGLENSENLHLTCTSTSFQRSVNEVTDGSKILVKLVESSLLQGSGKNIGAPDNMEGLCLSCKQVLAGVDNFLSELEIILDDYVPEWRSLPFAEVIDNFIHETIVNLEKFCPNMVSIQKFQRKQLSALQDNARREIGSHLDEIKIAMNEIFKIADQAGENYLKQSLQKPLARIVESTADIESFICGVAEHAVSELEATLDILKTTIDIKEVTFLIDFVESKLKGVSSLVGKVCDDHEEKNQYATINLNAEALLHLTLFSPELKSMAGLATNLRGIPASGNIEFSCDGFISSIEQIITNIESELSKIFPEWKSLPLAPEIDNFVHLVLDFVDKECSSQVKSLLQHELVKKVTDIQTDRHCLTDAEKEQVTTAARKAKQSLSVVAGIVDIRASIESNPLKKAALTESAKVIRIAGAEVLENVTKLADEFCGSCTELVHATEDIFLTVETALFDVEPQWKHSPIYAGVTHVIQTTFTYLDGFCFKGQATLLEDTQCLTPSEQSSLKGYVATADSVLSYAATLLDDAAGFLADGDLKNELVESATTIRAVDKDLVRNFTKIADETCGSCKDIFQGLQDFDNAVESALSDVDSDWRSNSKLSIVASSVHTIIGILQTLCPEVETLIVPAEGRLLRAAANIIAFSESLGQTQEEVASGDISSHLLLTWIIENNMEIDTSFEYDEYHMLSLTLITSANIIQKSIGLMVLEEVNFEDRRQLQVLGDMFYLLKTSLTDILEHERRTNGLFDCETIINAIDSAIREVEHLIEAIVPTIKNSDIFTQAENVLKIMLDIMHDYCANQN